MKFFLCGGGSGEQTREAILLLNEKIDNSKPLLYIPLAMDSSKYDSCYEWIKEELKDVKVSYIDMVRTIDELLSKDLNLYGAIFIGGGNTFKLLSELKTCGILERLKNYLDNDGIIFGGSAGAIILGECINTCKYSDENRVGLVDLMGMNVLNNFSLLCHFTNQSPELTILNQRHLLKLSKEEKIFALPEEVTIYYEDGRFDFIGSKPCYIFENGNRITLNDRQDKVSSFLSIRDENELMDFLNCNITYGWLDRNNRRHLNNLKNFRQNYKISSIEDTLKSGLGTCIEQAKLIKAGLEKLGFETRLYCYRAYENEDNFDQDVRMHCFVLYFCNDAWYHFEHSNQPLRGIHKYDSKESAIESITSGYEKKDVRKLTEIPDIIEGMSFKEFNEYVNLFDKAYLIR